MHWWVCLWTRFWASLTLCSCWAQGDAQTPAGHISRDIWGPNKVTQTNPTLERCWGLCWGFAPLVESFKRKTALPDAQLLLWAKHPSYETINSKSLIQGTCTVGLRHATQPPEGPLNSAWKTYFSFGNCLYCSSTQRLQLELESYCGRYCINTRNYSPLCLLPQAPAVLLEMKLGKDWKLP